MAHMHWVSCVLLVTCIITVWWEREADLASGIKKGGGLALVGRRGGVSDYLLAV